MYRILQPKKSVLVASIFMGALIALFGVFLILLSMDAIGGTMWPITVAGGIIMALGIYAPLYFRRNIPSVSVDDNYIVIGRRVHRKETLIEVKDIAKKPLNISDKADAAISAAGITLSILGIFSNTTVAGNHFDNSPSRYTLLYFKNGETRLLSNDDYKDIESVKELLRNDILKRKSSISV